MVARVNKSSSKITWTIQDQLDLMRRKAFVVASKELVDGITMYKPKLRLLDRLTEMDDIQRAMFQREDEVFAKLSDFMWQQHVHGYAGAWERGTNSLGHMRLQRDNQIKYDNIRWASRLRNAKLDASERLAQEDSRRENEKRQAILRTMSASRERIRDARYKIAEARSALIRHRQILKREEAKLEALRQ